MNELILKLAEARKKHDGLLDRVRATTEAALKSIPHSVDSSHV